MRRIRYAVAMSLDGYIAGPNGEADWIIMDPDIDFGAVFNQFDTVLLGRRTYEAMASTGNAVVPGMKTFVFSRTLQQRDHPKVTIVAEEPEEASRMRPSASSFSNFSRIKSRVLTGSSIVNLQVYCRWHG